MDWQLKDPKGVSKEYFIKNKNAFYNYDRSEIVTIKLPQKTIADNILKMFKKNVE